MTLADLLEDWTDWDGAAHALGRALGVFEEDEFTRVNTSFELTTTLATACGTPRRP
jgi:hypothetical protein